MDNEKRPNKNLLIYDFTEPELRFLRHECNFGEDELEYFNLRAKHFNNLQIAMKMNISEGKVLVLAKKVKNKIKRVLS